MQFAKVREEQGHLAEAAVEYERAGDAASSVRLLLETGNVNKAFGVSRRSGSATAAALIVKHCVGQSNWAGACLLYTSPSPRDRTRSRMPSSA